MYTLVCFSLCICIYVYIYRERERGAPRNPAPRNHSLVWIVKTSGCRCTDGHLTSRVCTEDH